MTQPALTADLIAESLINTLTTARDVAGQDCEIGFVHKGGGELSITLYDSDPGVVDEYDCRTFRLVEVES